jgi:hypothetical protein
LRAEAGKQNESNVLPILILDWPNPEVDKADTPSVENIGKGPAFNVQIAPIAHAGLKVTFPEFGLLQVKDRNAPLMQITQAVESTPGHLIQRGFMPNTQTLAEMIQRHEFPTRFTVTIRYEDLTRKVYSTAFTITFDPLRELFSVTFCGMKRL